MEAVASQPPSAKKEKRSQVAGLRRAAAATSSIAGLRDGLPEIDFLHEISSRMAATDWLPLVLDRIVDFIASVIACDSCFI